jgi:hypothetical protein
MLDGFGVPNLQCSGMEIALACAGIPCGMGGVARRSECQ